MSETVFDQIAGERKSLLDKITKNEELATVVQDMRANWRLRGSGEQLRAAVHVRDELCGPIAQQSRVQVELTKGLDDFLAHLSRTLPGDLFAQVLEAAKSWGQAEIDVTPVVAALPEAVQEQRPPPLPVPPIVRKAKPALPGGEGK